MTLIPVTLLKKVLLLRCWLPLWLMYLYSRLRALHVCLRIPSLPTAYIQTFQGPPHGIQSRLKERNCSESVWSPSIGMYYVNQNRDYPLISMVESFMNVYAVDLILPKMMKRFIPNQPFMRSSDPFLFCAEAIYQSQAEVKWNQGTLLSSYCCAGTCEEMMKRALLENWELFLNEL